MNVFQAAGSHFKNRNIAGLLIEGQSIRTGEALSDDQLRSVAPSIFAEGAHESRSERYAYIPSIQVVHALRDQGFFPVAVAQSRTRDASKQDHTKHLVRFRRDSALEADSRHGVPEAVLINSHDGSSSYWVLEGAFRAACKNGLIVATGDVQGVKIGHTGKILERVVEGTYQVIANANRAIEVSREWAQVGLDRDERHVFARAAAQLRYEGDDRVDELASKIQIVRRAEDVSNDLWTVFNRVQEGLLRGGQTYRSEAGRRVSARPVKSIDRNVGLNQALWTLGNEMAKLKGVAVAA